MRVMKFSADFSFDIDAKIRKTWPVGWPVDMVGGEIPDAAAFAARKQGAAEFTGDDSQADEAWFQEQLASQKEAAAKLEDVPENWKSLNAADSVDLAKHLGAGDDVTTKAAAQEFIAKALADKPLL